MKEEKLQSSCNKRLFLVVSYRVEYGRQWGASLPQNCPTNLLAPPQTLAMAKETDSGLHTGASFQ